MGIDAITLSVARNSANSAISSALTGVASISTSEDKTRLIVTAIDGGMYELEVSNQISEDKYNLLESLSITDNKLYINGQEIHSGYTYTPSIDSTGNLSWINDGGLPNPDIINIKGRDGLNGKNGTDGRNGVDGITPTVSIGENGNWIINSVDTGKYSKGEKGEDGRGFAIAKIYQSTQDAIADYMNVSVGLMIAVISSSGADVYIRNNNAVDGGGNGDKDIEHYSFLTSLSDASVIRGEKGDIGNNGITPHVDPTTGNWFLDTVNTGIKARGETGESGISPHVGDNGNWFVGELDTGVSAAGGGGSSLSPSDRAKLDIITTSGTEDVFLSAAGTYVPPNVPTPINATIQPMKKFELSLVEYGVSIAFEEPDNTYDDEVMTAGVVGVLIRKKQGGYPKNQLDGLEVLNIVSSDFGKYKEMGYVDNFVDNGETWYYKAFPYTDTERYGNNASNQANITVSAEVTHVYGFKLDTVNSDPFTNIEYLGSEHGCYNYGLSSAYMNYNKNVFDYGGWANAWFIKGIKPCMLKYDGTVDYELNKNDYNYRADGTSLSDIANDDYEGNAMVGIPKTYFKIAQEGTDTFFYFSNVKIDEDYHCWSHIDANGEEIDYCYMPIYNGSLVGTRLRSLSGKSLSGNYTLQQEMTQSVANNIEEQHIWQLEYFSDRQLINMLILLIGKSTHTQTIFGNGHISEVAADIIKTGTMNISGLFYGANNVTSGVKLFGMENYWGNKWRRLIGALNVSGTLKIKMTYGQQDGSTVNGFNITGNGYINAGITYNSLSSSFIKKCIYNTFGIFPNTIGASASTYLCDYMAVDNATNGTRYYETCGCNSNGYMGAFTLSVIRLIDTTQWYCSSSISCKPLKTP